MCWGPEVVTGRRNDVSEEQGREKQSRTEMRKLGQPLAFNHGTLPMVQPMKKLFCATLLSALFVPASAQVNAKGVVQVGLGVGLGAHATHFNSEVRFGNLAMKHSDDDGAVTVTFPIEVQYGMADRFSLGICLEPGRYLDSAGTHPNALFLLALSPRFYAVNKDHFAVLFDLDLGLNYLQIESTSLVAKVKDRYQGGFFRPGCALQWYFGETVGLNVGLYYTAHTFKWKDRDPDDPILDAANYSATLKTSGVLFQAGLQAKF